MEKTAADRRSGNKRQRRSEFRSGWLYTGWFREVSSGGGGDENVDEENIREWLDCDTNESGFKQLTDQEITDKTRGTNEEQSGRRN